MVPPNWLIRDKEVTDISKNGLMLSKVLSWAGFEAYGHLWNENLFLPVVFPRGPHESFPSREHSEEFYSSVPDQSNVSEPKLAFLQAH